jgi:hypothetical protein
MGILDIPPELLVLILRSSMPDGFESFMLTCKAVYATGFGLIKEHKAYESWISTCFNSRIQDDRLYIYDSFDLLLSWVQLDQRRRYEHLLYIKRVDIHRIGRIQSYHAEKIKFIMGKIKTEEPWLLEIINLVLGKLESFGLNCNTHNQPLIPCKLGILPDYLPMCADAYGDISTGKTLVHVPELCQALVLGLLPNLQSLVIHYRRCMDEYVSALLKISALVDRDRGKSCFTNLHEIYIDYGYFGTLDDLVPLLSLPQLETLAANKVRENYQDAEINNLEHSYGEWPEGKMKSLKRLILFDVEVSAERFAKFMSLIQFVQTFVWESAGLDSEIWEEFNADRASPTMYMRYPVAAEAGRDERSGNRGNITPKLVNAVKSARTSHNLDDKVNEPVAQEFWTPLLEYDSAEDTEEVGDFELRIDKGVYSGNRTTYKIVEDRYYNYWNPAEFLQILLKHKETLQQLNLTMVMLYQPLKIENECRIVHFRDFKALTHLEYDIRIVKTRNRRNKYKPWLGLPASLSVILPPSIEVVRVVMGEPEFHGLHEMLRRLVPEKHRFPNFRLVHVRMASRDTTSNAQRKEDHCIFTEISKRIRQLRHSLSRVGITLELDRTRDNIMRARVERDDRSLHQLFSHQQVHGDPHSFIHRVGLDEPSSGADNTR